MKRALIAMLLLLALCLTAEDAHAAYVLIRHKGRWKCLTIPVRRSRRRTVKKRVRRRAKSRPAMRRGWIRTTDPASAARFLWPKRKYIP